MSNDETESGGRIWSPDKGSPDVLTVLQFIDETGDHVDVFSGESIHIPDVGETILIGRLDMGEGDQGENTYQVVNKIPAYYKVELGNNSSDNGNDENNGEANDDEPNILQLLHIRLIVKLVSG